MRKHRHRANKHKLNLDCIEDEWLWLHSTEPLLEEVLPWTELEIMYIFDCLLENSLKNLADTRCSPQTILEIYQWITAIEDKNPFSFNNCCKLSCLDADEMREAILKRVNLNNCQLH